MEREITWQEWRAAGRDFAYGCMLGLLFQTLGWLLLWILGLQ